ncbi:RNA polymerase sigma factor [Aureliella helgolandensis]|uniref:RNA polymerase sigma factor n=1 Tax=Aureliella helgolandensis TaxID=2527968 RepID=A0A518G6P6_9BACT|nr:sigma-70 family RNA polymerase sigma factor [Aureliella helgolandensis]QDV24263.1 RNA polymerase sigma factor SigM [Aureliella helgolandensis]
MQVNESDTELELTELVQRHQTTVWRYLRALGAEAALADDLTQDTFLEIMRRPLKQFSDAATASYLRRVAHNLFITRRRRDGRMTVTDQVEQMENAWMRWAGFDSGEHALDALLECFSRLTHRAQQALKMRFSSDETRQAIAEALNISEHGAKNLMQRAKMQLKECVEVKLQ